MLKIIIYQNCLIQWRNNFQYKVNKKQIIVELTMTRNVVQQTSFFILLNVM